MDSNYLKPKDAISYSDLDFSFLIHPVTKDLILSKNHDAIKKSLKNLVLTNHYERLFHPEIGSNVNRMLFEPMISITANYLETEIHNVITNYEPRVKLAGIDIEPLPDNNALKITITYYEQHSTIPTVFDVILERLR
jgi:phage baseplate assembly protein W